MCRRGGSKGGKHPAGTPQVTHSRTQTVATQESHRQTKSNPVGEITHWVFFSAQMGQIRKTERKQGADYPCGKIKIL